MHIHIIKPGETIETIVKKYNVTVNEIKEVNTHFRSWEHLAPGAKLRIPELSEYLKDEIDEIDPFIEDYYPKLNMEEIIKDKNQPIKEEIKPVINEKITKSNKPNNYYYYPYYGYYNYYPYRRKRWRALCSFSFWIMVEKSNKKWYNK